MTKAFRRDERYWLSSQLCRAALSAPTNIAEGASQEGGHVFSRHLNIAVGSLEELSYLLRLCKGCRRAITLRLTSYGSAP